MRRINYTRPQRLHVIRNEDGLYFTLILFGFRLHFTAGRSRLPDGGLWP